MAGWEFKRRVARPKALSDPFNDFSSDTVACLLAKSDEELCWFDYQCLLGPYLPAGTYEESLYFLPLAFQYILENDDEALDLVTSLVWFVSQYAVQLDRDGVLTHAREQIEHCLQCWTGEFKVQHFDSNACREKGWGRNYFDYVKFSETVIEATRDLTRFKSHADIAVSFYRGLSTSVERPIESAWFLECARALASNDVYRPPDIPDIRELLRNERLLENHMENVRVGLSDFDANESYWCDTFALLLNS